jgi:malate dehydrogenase (oxaloacetate-decarboxylating)
VLIGVSGHAGLFNRDVIEEMGRWCDRPIVMPMSNPTSHTEVTPAAAIAWSGGRAIVATGSPFPPVVHDGVTHRIGQANNTFIFPGMGLGVVTVGAREVTDGMFHAASVALSEATEQSLVAASQIFPDIDDVRGVSRAVAIAVAKQAMSEGVAEAVDDLEARIDAEMWFPEYVPIRASSR